MRDDAVSPVIGVMLMLSITIILAAVLMAFAGGMADTKPAAPSVELSAEFVNNGEDIVLLLSHSGGEPLNPQDIRVTAYVKNAASSGTPLIIKDLIAADDTAWNAGETITLAADKTEKLLGIDDTEDAAAKSTPVEIGVYHLPSSNVIYQRTIILEVA